MDDKELQDIKAREAAATKGEWCWRGYQAQVRNPDGYTRETVAMLQSGLTIPMCIFVDALASREDMEFIAYAREDIPRLLAEIERLKAQQPDDHTTT